MVVRGIVEEKISDNLFRVRIPEFDRVFVHGNEGTYEATVCCPSGYSVNYKYGDSVFVDFEDNSKSSPVILGGFGEIGFDTSAIVDSIVVKNSAKLPKNTKINDVSPKDIGCISGTKNNIQLQLDNVRERQADVENSIEQIEEDVLKQRTDISSAIDKLSSIESKLRLIQDKVGNEFTYKSLIGSINQIEKRYDKVMSSIGNIDGNVYDILGTLSDRIKSLEGSMNVGYTITSQNSYIENDVSGYSPIKCIMYDSSCYKDTTQGIPVGVLWHSTGVNNPNILRYVQPSKSDQSYQFLINKIGKNRNGNDWNSVPQQAGLNAWVGKLDDGTVSSVQTLPWNYRPWGCGSGNNGSCNGSRSVKNSAFWIQFEICEDNLSDATYFKKAYDEACRLTAFLCKKFNINPNGFINYNGVQVPTILCHYDSYRLGLGSGHYDIYNWFPKFGKCKDMTMNDVRKDVASLVNN